MSATYKKRIALPRNTQRVISKILEDIRMGHLSPIRGKSYLWDLLPDWTVEEVYILVEEGTLP